RQSAGQTRRWTTRKRQDLLPLRGLTAGNGGKGVPVGRFAPALPRRLRGLRRGGGYGACVRGGGVSAPARRRWAGTMAAWFCWSRSSGLSEQSRPAVPSVSGLSGATYAERFH